MFKVSLKPDHGVCIKNSWIRENTEIKGLTAQIQFNFSDGVVSLFFFVPLEWKCSYIFKSIENRTKNLHNY